MKRFILLFPLFLSISLLSAQYLWTHQSLPINNRGGMEGADLAQDPWGNTYVFANFTGEIRLDSITVTENGTVSDDGPLILVKYSPDGDVIWAKPVKGKNSNNAHGVATDADGNVYITGEYEQTNSFTLLNFGDGITLTGNASQSIFLAKADSSGSFLWATSILATDEPGTQFVTPKDMEVVGGSIFLTGQVQEPATVNGQIFNTENDGKAQLFLTRYDTAGNFQWFKHTNKAGRFGTADGQYMRLAPNNTLYVLGLKGDSIRWEGEVLAQDDMKGQVWINLDLDGNLVWAESGAAFSRVPQQPQPFGVDDASNVYFAIRTEGTSFVGDTSFFAEAQRYLVSYTSSGQRRFARPAYTSSTGITLESVVTSPGGVSYVFGKYVGGGLIIGQDTLPIPMNFGEYNYISALDASGNILGGRSLMDSYVHGGGIFTDIDAKAGLFDNEGNIVLMNNFEGRATAGSDTLDSQGGVDQFFLMKFQPVGLLDITTRASSPFPTDWKIYPNPSKGQIMVEATHPVEEIRVFTSQGKMIHQQHMPTSRCAVDLSTCPSGIYILQAKYKHQTFTQKIMIH